MINRCYWITGLSASGKTTISKILKKNLEERKQKVILLDGDNLREIFQHTEYDNKNRLKYSYTYSKLCEFLVKQHFNVIISIGGLFHELHNWNRKNIPRYVEIFLDVPLVELEKRDPKGLYKNYRKGIIKNLNGFDIQPQFPKNPDIHIKWKSGDDPTQTFKIINSHLNNL